MQSQNRRRRRRRDRGTNKVLNASLSLRTVVESCVLWRRKRETGIKFCVDGDSNSLTGRPPQVSWMRRLVGENELQLLTVGNNTYSGDLRYAVHYQYPNNWRLKITKTQVTDEGTYECQLSTHPPRVIQYNLHINGEWRASDSESRGDCTRMMLRGRAFRGT